MALLSDLGGTEHARPLRSIGLADGSQAVTDTFRYDAWGNVLQGQGTTNPAYQWVGEEGYYLNPDAGLYLLGMRHYSPTRNRSRPQWQY